EGARAISGQTMRDTILVNRGTCYACAVACKREVEVKELGVTPKYGGPEYETLAASGSLCGVSDLNALALINQLYAQYVLDSISTTGADHMEAPHDPLYAGFHPQGHPLGVLGLIEPLDPLTLDAKKVRAFFETQKVWSAYNSVGMCDFVGTPLNGLELQPMIDYINGVTGWNMSLYELMKVGERNNTLARLFNCREGFTPEDDVLPQRMHEGI